MTVQLRIFASDLTTLTGTLDQPYDIEWDRQPYDVGAGQFTIPHDSPAVQALPALLDPDSLVVVRVDGTDRFGWLLRRAERRRGDVWDPVAFGGPGVTEVLRAATVEAIRQYGDCPVETDQRLFGAMSPEYDDSAWLTGDAIWSHGTSEAPTPPNLLGVPEDWPDPRSEWLWTEEPTGDPLVNTEGTSYFRRKLVVPAGVEGRHRMWVTAANSFVAWWDGAEVATGRDYRRAQTVDVDLCPGETHQFAAMVTNQTPPPGWGGQNIGALNMTMLRLNDDETFDESLVVYRTFTPAVYGGVGAADPWRALHLPAEPPGMTAGHIILTLLAEAQTRGVLTQVTTDFTASLDSDGQAWGDEVEFACQVGDDNVMSVIERLRDLGVDAELDVDMVLHAWTSRGVDRTATVVVPVEQAGELAETWDDERVDALQVRTDEGWIRTPEPPTADRREGYLELGLIPSNATGELVADRVLDEMGSSRGEGSFVVDGQAGDVPGVDYDVADLITAPTVLRANIVGAWTGRPVEVRAISSRVTPTGRVAYVVEWDPVTA